MLFDKARKYINNDGEPSQRKSEKPLTCMIFFFASQMTRNLQEPEKGASEHTDSAHRIHRLDSLLAEARQHAERSPYVTRFEAIPVEMAPPGRPPGTSREEMHDTLLLASFKNKTAWQQWIQTPEWQQFMQRTEQDVVFRRIPHVRCAQSLKGLRNPLEVLTA
jgi:hypothetical protein